MSSDEDAPAVGSTQGVPDSRGPFTIYAAGGLFNQHELATNVLIKEAVGRLSNGRFQLALPQSKDLKELDALEELDVAYLRNADLLGVVTADIVLARFDGLELDSGTVVEFTMAKSLGKPTVILRTDFRHLSGTGIEEPYNLMARSWPRTVEVHIPSLQDYVVLLAEERVALGEGLTGEGLTGESLTGEGLTFEATLTAELNTVQRGFENIAVKIIDGLEAVIKMESPYPAEYREMVYRALRFSPGSGFDQMLTEDELEKVIQRLRKNGTL
jgi:nucleoside 2-deoxyribosyltransferase